MLSKEPEVRELFLWALQEELTTLHPSLESRYSSDYYGAPQLVLVNNLDQGLVQIQALMDGVYVGGQYASSPLFPWEYPDLVAAVIRRVDELLPTNLRWPTPVGD